MDKLGKKQSEIFARQGLLYATSTQIGAYEHSIAMPKKKMDIGVERHKM